MADIRVLATDLEFPEGPVVMPDGSVVLVEIRGQRLTRNDDGARRRRRGWCLAGRQYGASGCLIS